MKKANSNLKIVLFSLIGVICLIVYIFAVYKVNHVPYVKPEIVVKTMDETIAINDAEENINVQVKNVEFLKVPTLNERYPLGIEGQKKLADEVQTYGEATFYVVVDVEVENLADTELPYTWLLLRLNNGIEPVLPSRAYFDALNGIVNEHLAADAKQNITINIPAHSTKSIKLAYPIRHQQVASLEHFQKHPAKLIVQEATPVIIVELKTPATIE